jgi:hypothetical protein
MLLDHCKGLKIVLSFAVFHAVLSELHHLVAIAEEYILRGGVDEAAGVNVRRLGKGEPHISTHLIAKGQSLSTDIMPRSPTFTLPAFFFSKNMEE